MLLATLIAGAVAMASMVPIENFTLSLFGTIGYKYWAVALVAATHEELTKLLIVILIAVLVPKQFNDPMDGIVYGSIAGIGMAFSESLFHLSWSPEEEMFLPRGELVRLLAHPVMGGIGGFAIGMRCMKMHRWEWTLVACITFVIAVHFLWDCIAIHAHYEGVGRWHSAGAIGLMLTGILVYGMLIVVGSDWSRKVFAPHTPCQLWGWPFTLFMNRPEYDPERQLGRQNETKTKSRPDT